MRKLRTLLFLFGLLFISLAAESQDGAGKGSFDTLMRSSGRIYVVIAVMLTILLGLIIYVARLDRKIGKLEKDNH